jgi:hypothetical protein
MTAAQQQTAVSEANPAIVGSMVRWKDEEVFKVASRVIAISRAEAKDPLAHFGYGRTIFEAQNVLTSSRHRPLTSVTGEKNQKVLKEVIRTILDIEQNTAATQKQALASAAQPDVKTAPNPLSHLNGTHNDTKIKHISPGLVGKSLPTPSTPFTPREVALEPEELQAVAELTLEGILEAAGKKLASTIADAFMGEIRQRFAAELPKMAARANSVNKKLPKILVVGPLSKQQPALEAAVDGIIELKFVSSEERANMIRERGKYCVGALVWTQFVNHSHTEAVQSMFKGDSFRLVSGTNMEALKGALEDLALHYNN